ncbi:MAG: DUF4331 domain-containing protein [Solirubrobacterales bacterium]|nr:DUF4331 domain-containing protein [Solirubrobacterales bacterium]
MRRMTVLAAALPSSLAAVAVAVTLSAGSSHREAPLTSADPLGDDTDVWFFTPKTNPDQVAVVANWVPFEDPAGGPNFYRFDDRARYYINFDNTGDGKADVRYRFDFRTQFNDKNYLHSLTTVDSLDSPNLFQKERYELIRETFNSRGKRTSARSLGKNFRVAPSNVGPKTMPNYESLWPQAIKSLSGGGRVFAGQRDDAFFLPLDRVFDSVNLAGAGTGNEGGGIDTIAGYGVQSIVLQLPEKAITRNRRSVAGPDAANATVGAWASTERQRVQITNRSSKRSARSETINRRTRDSVRDAKWVQVSRLANPLVNELFIPTTLKDRYNRQEPSGDGAQFGKFALNPFLAGAFNQLFGLGIKETDRTDIVQAFFTGVPGLNQISPNPTPADTLKLNMGVPPAETENRFGVIGGDNAGFPNGRRLGDDVVDIELRVLGGFLIPEDQGGKKLPLGDGVDRNDQDFLPDFPYVPSLKNEIGGSPTEDRQEPTHPPTPGDAPS